MKTSTAQNSWGEQTDEITAQLLATKVRKKARLREIAEESSVDFFIGGSILANIVRIGTLLALGVLYFRSASFSSFGVWPIFALGGFVEALRSNRRLDALLELQTLEAEDKDQANKSDMATANKPLC